MADPARRPESGPIQSEFAGDPEMKELIALFLTELPQRINAIDTAYRAADSTSLTRLSHQLRGASAGYGFPTIGTAAGKVEDALRSLASTDPSQALARVSSEVRTLVDLCRRACAS